MSGSQAYSGRIDYQIQTTASDGRFSPRECVRMAQENGVTSIAITDHDTIGGVKEALEAGKEFGIEVIPGIELSCDHENHGIHILGLGIDYHNEALLEKLHVLQNEREHRAKLIIEKLRQFGFAVDFEEVKRRAEGVVARPHIAEAVLENPLNEGKLSSEGIATRQDFFAKYIADGAKAYVHGVPLFVADGILLIHEARGIAIWSHPTVPMRDYKLVEETLLQFLGWQMDGLEVIGNFSEDDTEFLQTLAAKYQLLRSAGSDFHDTYTDPQKPEEGAARIGGHKTFGYSIEGVRESLLAAIEKRHAVVK
ncbi:MAG: PHP domain-containing protein [Candidatus Sungbacteria bacterium]|uniref:PHP domain-containing protein n=1 Tax=Candidatus Sungiibacteriota bacterium TaxID=2750080 RepID=A0A931SBG4_9BACT|nr:PHP domain-containing protein [Candidatus Sungbacteria bacterium]